MPRQAQQERQACGARGRFEPLDRARGQRRQRRDDRGHAAAQRRSQSRPVRTHGTHQRPADPRRRSRGAGAARDPAAGRARRRVRRCCSPSTGRTSTASPTKFRSSASSVMIGDPDEGEPPEVFTQTGARYRAAVHQEDGQGDPRELAQHGRARPGRRAGGIPAEALETALRDSWKKARNRAAGQPGALRAGIAAAAGHRRRAASSCPGNAPRQALAHQRQRGGGLRRDPRRRSLRRRVSDHARDRAARMDGARADQGRRHAAAGRGRARLHQHDHRRRPTAACRR